MVLVCYPPQPSCLHENCWSDSGPWRTTAHCFIGEQQQTDMKHAAREEAAGPGSGYWGHPQLHHCPAKCSQENQGRPLNIFYCRFYRIEQDSKWSEKAGYVSAIHTQPVWVGQIWLGVVEFGLVWMSLFWCGWVLFGVVDFFWFGRWPELLLLTLGWKTTQNIFSLWGKMKIITLTLNKRESSGSAIQLSSWTCHCHFQWKSSIRIKQCLIKFSKSNTNLSIFHFLLNPNSKIRT